MPTMSRLFVLVAFVTLSFFGTAQALCKQARGFYVMTDNNCQVAYCNAFGNCSYTPCHSYSIEHTDGSHTAIDRIAGAASFTGGRGTKKDQVYEWSVYSYGNNNGLYITATGCGTKYGYTCEKMTRVTRSLPGVSKFYYKCGTIGIPA